MTIRSPEPYCVDELKRKHEGYPYDDSDTRVVAVEHKGRSFRLLMPDHMPPIDIKVTATAGDLLFLLGEQLDEEDEDGIVIEGGDGIVMVARRHPNLGDTYWLAVWHCLFPEAAWRLGGKE
jgi:hypothetical protein